MDAAALVAASLLAIALSAPAAERSPSDPPRRAAASPVRSEADLPAPAASTEPPLDIGDRVIRKAIADAKDPMDNVASTRGGVFGGGAPTRAETLDRRFKDAEIPSCLTSDTFRFDPPMLGPIPLVGLLALPFWAHAIVTGRCRH